MCSFNTAKLESEQCPKLAIQGENKYKRKHIFLQNSLTRNMRRNNVQKRVHHPLRIALQRKRYLHYLQLNLQTYPALFYQIFIGEHECNTSQLWTNTVFWELKRGQ